MANTTKDLPYPVFINAADAIPPTETTYNPEVSYLAAVFAQDLANGAGSVPNNDFWVDKMLARDGVPPDEAGGQNFINGLPENIDYDNNVVMFSRGRALYMEDSQPGLGFRGDIAYIDSLGDRSAYTMTAHLGALAVALTENEAKRHNTPSYWYSEFAGGGLLVKQTKFIAHQNVAVERLQITTTDGTTKELRLDVASPFATMPGEGGELTGVLTAPHNVTRVTPRLSGDSFTMSGASLTRTVTVTPSLPADVKVQMGFVTDEIPESRTRYQQIRDMTPQVAYSDQTRTYNQWWVDNIPYVQTPSGPIDKMVFYRWWLLRTNFLDANIPGNDYQFPTSIEGVFGRAYNNAIVLTAGMFIDDLKYFRDPSSAYGTWLSAGQVARRNRYIDNPGNPVNWSSSYANYISEAAWRSYQLHGGDPSIARKLAHYAEDDVKGQLEAMDGNSNNLIEYTSPAFTGNDTDAVSFSWRHINEWTSYPMDRPESAYLYSGAKSAAAAYAVAGDSSGAARMSDKAQAIKESVLGVLWENKRGAPDESGLYGNMIKAAYSTAGSGLPQGYQIPWKEVNMFYPYTVGLMPKAGEPDFNAKYLDAFRLFVDQRQYSPFPFYTANQADAKARAARDTGKNYSNNFSTINSTVMFRLLASTLRNYSNPYLTSDYYKKLLYWNAWASYEKGDVSRHNENEFWAHGSAENGGSIKYRSWIHQTQLGTTNFTVLEDVAGLQPRTDDVLQLSPIDIGWDRFTVNNVKYHDKDLTVVWDKPGDGVDHYPTAPEGYSAYLDGNLAFTVDSLKPVTYNTTTGAVTTNAVVLTRAAHPVKEAQSVRFAASDRVVDLLAKAGVDVDPSTSTAANVAAGAAASSSYSASGSTSAGHRFLAGGAVDGSAVNEPFWGTAGSSANNDWLQVDFGQTRRIDEARVHFYRSSSSATVSGYAPPAHYAVQYWDGSRWVGVSGQARTPSLPTGNLNRLQFAEVQTSKVRILVTHQSPARTGITEVQFRDTGAVFQPDANKAPSISVVRDNTFNQAGRARFNGSVSDDGLPDGTLNVTWSVVSAPDGGSATFTDSSSPATTVSFTKPGTYTLRLSADDGEKSTSSEQTVEVSDDFPPGPDVSNIAAAKVSYVTAWNRVAALNDDTTHVSSPPDQTRLWGTFRDNNRPATEWVEYSWPEPRRVSSARAFFWNDSAQGSGSGVALPQSWKLQYRDDFGFWQDVRATSPYPVTPMSGGAPQPSKVSFDGVEATAIRATFQASPGLLGLSYSAVALSELDVYGENPQSYERVARRTNPGSPVSLPPAVTVAYSDGQRESVNVEWNAINPSLFDQVGQHVVTGVLAASSYPIEATVSVAQTGSDVGSVADQVTQTYLRRAPDLPRSVVVSLVGGSGALENRAVTWQPVDPSLYSSLGSFVVEGAVPGTTIKARVTVSVESDPGGDAPGTPEDAKVGVVNRNATIAWSPAQTAEGNQVSGYELTVDPILGAPTRQVIAPERRAHLLEDLPLGDYLVRLRTIADGRTSDGVDLRFAVLGQPSTPTMTFSPGDPDGSGGWYTTAPSVSGSIPSANIAPFGAAASATTAAHNSVAGLNDGHVFYSGNDGNLSSEESQRKVWGTWTASARPAKHVINYEWGTPKRIDSTTVHFWSDSGSGVGEGVAVPRGWQVQYRTSNGSWAEVQAVGGYPVNRTSPNQVGFAAVSTTALRLILDADTDGSSFAAVAISEWEVGGVEESTVAQVNRGDGTWTTLTTGSALPDGTHIVTGRALTITGLVSPSTTPVAVKVDTTPPSTPRFVGAPTGDHVFGDAIPEPTCQAEDATSGLAQCVVTGFKTTVGEHTLTATASDRAGLRSMATMTYRIKPYTLRGFYQPVDMAPVINVTKAGSTIPLLFGATRGSSELTAVEEVVSVTATVVTLDPGAPSDNVETLTSGAPGLTYDTAAGRYQYNWKTPAKGSYRLTVALRDGSTLSALFRLR